MKMADIPEPPLRSAYLKVADGTYRASALTRGPWDPNHQHAGPPIALACRAIESIGREHGFTHIARLTTALLRPVPIGDLTVKVATDYVGKTAGHLAARLSMGGKDVALMTALLQRELPVTLPEQLPNHPLPVAPKDPDDCDLATFPFASRTKGYADLVETRIADGQFFRGPCAAWFRLNYPLVEGEEPSAYQRVAVAADSGNGISAILDLDRYVFVNSDLTINLLRQPIGKWICIEAQTWLGANGSGLAVSTIYDTGGLAGRASQSLSVRSRH